MVGTQATRRWYTVKEAAGYLDVSVDTVRRLLRRGELRALRVRRVIRIAAATLDRFIARHSR